MAMHLLESGVSLVEIALFLGHESIETTNKYLAASLRLKRKALESLPPLGPWRRRPAEKEEERLIRLLESLQRGSRVPATSVSPLGCETFSAVMGADCRASAPPRRTSSTRPPRRSRGPVRARL